MIIAKICQRHVDTIRTTDSVQTAAHRMATRCVGTVVVVDAEQRPIGMLTDRDLAVRIVAIGADARTTMVVDVMSGQVVTITEDATIDDTLATMRKSGVRRLPVVNRQGRLVGIVSLEDVLACLTRELSDVGEFLRENSPAHLATS